MWWGLIVLGWGQTSHHLLYRRPRKVYRNDEAILHTRKMPAQTKNLGQIVPFVRDICFNKHCDRQQKQDYTERNAPNSSFL